MFKGHAEIKETLSFNDAVYEEINTKSMSITKTQILTIKQLMLTILFGRSPVKCIEFNYILKFIFIISN